VSQQNPEPSHQALPTPFIRVLLVLAFAALLLVRVPDVVFQGGRLWAEEGPIFFWRAAAWPWFVALFLPYDGYLNLVANMGSIIAWNSVRLEYAPAITTAIGLMFQCVPAVLLVCSHDAWLRPRWILIAALLIVATPPLVSEVWLQTLHSQFHLALGCALILALDVPSRRLAWFGGIVLLMAPLCGPAAVALLPLFLARAAIDGSCARLLQAAILGVGTCLQLALFYSFQPGRNYTIDPILLLCVVYLKQILVPLVGGNVAEQSSTLLQASIASHLFPWVPVLITIATVCAFASALLRRRHAASVWLFLAAGTLTGVGYFGSWDNLLTVGGNERYSFLPQVLAALSLLGLAAGHRLPERWVARAGVAWIIGIGILYVARFPPVVGPDLDWVRHGPSWSHEVALWRQDHHHSIVAWPGWKVTLPDPDEAVGVAPNALAASGPN